MQKQVIKNGKSERKSGNKYEINTQAYKSISYSSNMICQTAGTFKYIYYVLEELQGNRALRRNY